MFGLPHGVNSTLAAKEFAGSSGTCGLSLPSTSAGDSLWFSERISSSRRSDESDSDYEHDQDDCNFLTPDEFPFRSFHEPRFKALPLTYVTEFHKQPVLKRANSFSHFVHPPRENERALVEQSLSCSESGDNNVRTARAFLLLESGNVTAAESEVFTNYMTRALELADN